ncbi:3-dehydroquinate synthase [Legionella fairfieldensis]|uniref:3-dehydroquinate synthase n=1 Tax=Legionella fairfieldensis TaxID=45064 RepID=UPI00048A940B|nr:3-dehydroquinate synthase [Legionella fairfieldensis]
MVKSDLHQQLVVRIQDYEYPIIMGYGTLTDPEILHGYLLSDQILIVTNDTIAPLYLKSLKSVLTGRQCDVVILNDGEMFKNQQSLFAVYDTLIAHHHHRDTTLIALGGGVIGDITGFAAATYQRGVHCVQIPTTLLAQVDASIGGKTAINHPQAKNIIGSFHQPGATIIDFNTLQTLPSREFRAGLAEIIKYAFLTGGAFLELLENALREGLDARSDKLPAIINQCCQIKIKFIQEDVYEKGVRALLNLGHTFAHALETYSCYKRWLHGEAVAIGLYCAGMLSHRSGLLDEKSLYRIDNVLTMAGLPSRIPGDIDLIKLRALMSQDKKIKNKNLRFILMKAIGNCYIQEGVSEDNLRSALQSAVEGD